MLTVRQPRNLTPLALAWLLSLHPLSAAGQTTTVETPAERLRIGALFQPTLRYAGLEGEEDRLGFFVRRARIDLSGQAFEGRLRFRFVPDFAGTPVARDLWLEYPLEPSWTVRIGQQTVPFHQQRDLENPRGHFSERSLATRRFEVPGGRDQGVTARWTGVQGRASVQTGVFNGMGANRNDPGRSPLLATRGRIGLGGAAASSEADRARSAAPVVTLGAGAMGAKQSPLRPRPGFSATSDADWWSLTSDLHARYRGATLTLGGYLQEVRPETDNVTQVIEGDGWWMGGGWMLPGRDAELAFRHSESRWERARERVPATETAVGLNLFHLGNQVQTRIQLFRVRGSLPAPLQSGTFLVVEHQLLLGG
jgi:hypothetical protein